MLVCHCRGISDRQIRRAVKDGATSAREVARETGAGMRCGGCRSNVKAVVNERYGSPDVLEICEVPTPQPGADECPRHLPLQLE